MCVRDVFIISMSLIIPNSSPPRTHRALKGKNTLSNWADEIFRDIFRVDKMRQVNPGGLHVG